VLNPHLDSYFSRYALENVWLKDPKHAKYINKDILEKYYPVGGVRIEDDILVVEGGWENLTTAPRGEAALKIIRGEEQGSDDSWM
jgi:Xaa-Pro dipeptidase